MKKILIALLTAILCMTAISCAGETSPEPSADAEQTGDGISLTLMGKTVFLEYDSDPEYSNLQAGVIQASFYTEAADGTMYELYLLFPQTVKSGDEVTTESSMQAQMLDPGVMMFITDQSQELYAAAFQYPTGPYPNGSHYSIRFDSVETGADGAIACKGGMTATLIAMDSSYKPLYPIEGITGSFSFTFKAEDRASGGKLPQQPEVPEAPKASAAPASPNLPSLVTPPDAKKI